VILAVADKKSHKSAQMSAKKGVRETESPKKPVLKSILKSPFIPKWWVLISSSIYDIIIHTNNRYTSMLKNPQNIQ
jgi:hypothetical protein